MPQIVSCPFCQQQFTIGEDQYAGYVNSQVTCSSCKRTFSIVEEGTSLKGVDPAGAPPIAMAYAAPDPSGQTNGLALAGLICSIAGLVTCGMAGIAGLVCSILGLKRSKETGTGRGMAIAGIVIGSFSLLFVPALLVSILLPSLARAREKANEVKCASNLRVIGQALMMYSNDNRGILPPDFSYLSQYLPGGIAYVCPSANGTTTTSGSVSTNYIYLAKPGQRLGTQKNIVSSVLVYEPLSDHSGDGCNFLFFDGHVEFFSKKGAATTIKQLEQGANPPKLSADPNLPEE